MKTIVSIDIGYYNLGFVKARVCEEDMEPDVVFCDKVDITRYTHDTTPFCRCKLHHSSHMGDYVLHFLQEYAPHFDEADEVIIERQPPGGFGAIETLIFTHFREKITVVSPNAMHKHFYIGHLDYSRRKEKTMEFAHPYLTDLPRYHTLQRKHDVADAVCMILYVLSGRKRHKKIFVDDFDVFRYTDKKSNL